MSETPQTTLTAITLRVGKLAAYKSIGDKMEALVPEAKAGTISAKDLLMELINHLQAQVEELKND
jgi:hypothetical protein